MSFLDGLKTVIGGVSLIGGALYFAVQKGDLETAGLLFAGGMTALGLGGKLQKLIEALKPDDKETEEDKK